MSNEELLEIFYLKKEIQLLQREIKSVSSMRLFPEAHPIRDELLDLLKCRLERCQTEYNRGITFIERIPDIWLRTAFRLRYMEGMNWPEVGLKMSLSGDCCRQMIHRYLKRNKADTLAQLKNMG